MTKEDADYVLNCIENEGFHYCFNSYSRFLSIEDNKFHELRQNYLKSIQELKTYLLEIPE